MIQSRDDLDLDWDAVFEAAAATGTALEINGSPHRLDLARRAGAPRGRGGLPAVDRLRRAPDRGAGVCPLGRRPGAPGVGRAAARAQHAVAGRRSSPGSRRSPSAGRWARSGSPRGPRRGRSIGPRGAAADESLRDPRARNWCWTRVDAGRACRGLVAAGDACLAGRGCSRRRAAASAGSGVAGAARPGVRPIEALHRAGRADGGSARGDPARAAGSRAACRRSRRSPSRSTACSRSRPGCSRSPPGRPTADRSRVLLAAVVAAFVAFTGIAALVPGGLAGVRAADGPTRRCPLLRDGRADRGLALGDALVALLLGLSRRGVPLRDGPRCAAVGADVRDRGRGRRGGRPGHRPAAARRTGGADARALPLGRAPRLRPGAAPRAAVPVGDSCCSRRSGSSSWPGTAPPSRPGTRRRASAARV